MRACARDSACLVPRSQWYVARLAAGDATTNYITKGPGFPDPRWGNGGPPVTYPGAGASFLLPLRPPYHSVTIVLCGGSWANFNYDGAPRADRKHASPEGRLRLLPLALLLM